MKITIIKYLDGNGKIIDIRKDILKSSDLPKNIIEEYEVEIKDYVEIISIEDFKIKYSSGNYILIFDIEDAEYPDINHDWRINNGNCGFIWESNRYKLIHKNHKDVLEAYLKNSSIEIECTNAISKDADIETIWYSEENFIENYDENMYYRLKVKIPAWYEDENMIGKLFFDGLNAEYGLVINIKGNLIETSLDRKYSLSEINSYKLRPATESEVLSLVYKPQQKVSKEINLIESNRLKDLFLKDKAE